MECSEYRGGRIVSSDSELLTPPARAARYETLMRVSRAIGAHQNASGLFTALVDELNGVVDFDAIGVFLKCPNSDRFQNHFVHRERWYRMPHRRLFRTPTTRVSPCCTRLTGPQEQRERR